MPGIVVENVVRVVRTDDLAAGVGHRVVRRREPRLVRHRVVVHARSPVAAHTAVAGSPRDTERVDVRVVHVVGGAVVSVQIDRRGIGVGLLGIAHVRDPRGLAAPIRRLVAGAGVARPAAPQVLAALNALRSVPAGLDLR